MDEIKAAGWTRFKPVKGQAIVEEDLKKVFKMVDMDGSGAISHMVKTTWYGMEEYTANFSGTKNGGEISREKIWNK